MHETTDSHPHRQWRALGQALALAFAAGCAVTPKLPGAPSDLEDYEAFDLKPKGGRVSLGDGLVLEVPKGTVSQRARFYVRRLDRSEAPDPSSTVLSLRFWPPLPDPKQPLRLIAEPVALPPGNVPFVRAFDGARLETPPSVVRSVYDPGAKRLEVELPHASDWVVEARPVQQAKVDCEATPCRCKRFESKQSDSNAETQERARSCSGTESRLELTYTDCDGPVERHFVSEIGKDCRPELVVTPPEQVVEPGERVILTFNPRVGAHDFSSEDVDVSITEGGGSLAASHLVTNAAGVARVAYTAPEAEGTVVVTGRARVAYYRRYQSASGPAGGEIDTYGEPQIADVEGTSTLHVRKEQERYRVDLKIRADGGRAKTPGERCVQLPILLRCPYDFSVSYGATLSFEVVKPKGDAPFVSPDTGMGEQAPLVIRAKPHGHYTRLHPDALLWINGSARAARATNVQSPPRFHFGVLLRGFDPASNRVDLYVATPWGIDFVRSLLNGEGNMGLPLVPLPAFASADLELTTVWRPRLFGFIPLPRQTTQEIFEPIDIVAFWALSGKHNLPFTVVLEDGYRAEGAAWLGIWLEPPPTFEISVKKLE